MGTPCGFSHSEEYVGDCLIETVNRELGCAAGWPLLGAQGFPRQSSALLGAGSSCPSHQTVRSGRSATLVKIVSCWTIAIALGLVFEPVPGATPKNPASGLIAQSRPSEPTRSHAISSPIVWIFQPFMLAGGTSRARLVLPQALGNAPQM